MPNTSRFVILNFKDTDELTHEPLYWNKDFGWVSLSGATVYTEEDFLKPLMYRDLPIGWIAERLPNMEL